MISITLIENLIILLSKLKSLQKIAKREALRKRPSLPNDLVFDHGGAVDNPNIIKVAPPAPY